MIIVSTLETRFIFTGMDFKKNTMSKKKMECYIDYLDSKNGHRKARKDFLTYEKALAWMKKTFEKWDLDFISYY